MLSRYLTIFSLLLPGIVRYTDVRCYDQSPSIIKAIDEELVPSLSKGLQNTLVTGLKNDSPDVDAHETCATLAAENPTSKLGRGRILSRVRRSRFGLYNALR
jgi:hypothetical protein